MLTQWGDATARRDSTTQHSGRRWVTAVRIEKAQQRNNSLAPRILYSSESLVAHNAHLTITSPPPPPPSPPLPENTARHCWARLERETTICILFPHDLVCHLCACVRVCVRV